MQSSRLLARAGFDRSFLAYIAVSAAALGVDLLVLDRLLVANMPESGAAAFAYSIGIVVHWLLSTRTVFAPETAARGSRALDRQRALFIGSALVGLAITTAMVGTASGFGIEPRLAKLAAIGVSFTAVWLIRRLYIFSR